MNMSYSAPIMIVPSTSSTSILTKTSSSSLKSSYSSNSSSSYYSSTLMSCEFLSSLSKDLSLLLEDDVQDYNMIINVGQEPDFKTFRAHSMILRVRSPYFRAALLSEWTKTENNIIIFNKPNISPIVFELVLKFIYTGSLSLDDYDTPVLLDLLRAADELCIQELIDFVQDYLLCYKTGWIQRNFSTTYKLIHIHGDSFYKLKNYCNEIIRNDPELVFHSEDFSTLEEQALIKLLMRDDLGKEEIILWDHLVKWGASTSGIKTFDLTKWTYKEWELLSEKLENLIPLIRFLHISSGDFYKKVKPFARILPIELYEDLLQYYLVPNHQPSLELMQPKRSNFNSVIIERKQVAMIASWIDKKDLLVNKYNSKKRVNINNNPSYQSSFYEPWENPYEFKLLLRGSRDGFTGLDFHSKCDSKGATITIMKVNGSSELYGGYTPIDWLSQNTWGYCKESFIFCLDDKDLDKSIISRVKDPSRAINYYNNYGPSFGTGDLKMTGNFKNESRCCCQHGDYELPIRVNSDDIHFSVDEYEVFQIIPRRRRKRNMD